MKVNLSMFERKFHVQNRSFCAARVLFGGLHRWKCRMPCRAGRHAMEMGRRLYLWRLLRESPAVTEDDPTMPLRSSMAAAMNMRVDATQQVVARERWGLSRANTKMQTLASNSTTPNNRDFIVHP